MFSLFIFLEPDSRVKETVFLSYFVLSCWAIFFWELEKGLKGRSGDISGLWQFPVSLVFLWHWKAFQASPLRISSDVLTTVLWRLSRLWGSICQEGMLDQGRYTIRLKEVMDGGIQRGMGYWWGPLCSDTEHHCFSFHILSLASVNALLPSLDNKSSDWHWISSQISEILWPRYDRHYCAITYFKRISTKWYLNYLDSLNTFTSEN